MFSEFCDSVCPAYNGHATRLGEERLEGIHKYSVMSRVLPTQLKLQFLSPNHKPSTLHSALDGRNVECYARLILGCS